MPELKDKVVLVTGATGGIGSRAARTFVDEGAKVCLVDLNEEALRDLVASLGSSAVYCAADVSSADSALNYVKSAVDAFGRIDAAFLNAGILGGVARIADTSIETFDRVMSVNVRGVWLGLAALMPLMTKQGGGSIVVTSSIAGVRGSTGQAAYVASKHAVIGLMKTAAIEGAASNIRVNAICPAPVDTEMMKSIEHGLAPTDHEFARGKILSGIPMGRYASTAEIVQLAMFLVSERSTYCTGAAYMIDGGGTAGPSR